jgi:hypothetical protein
MKNSMYKKKIYQIIIILFSFTLITSCGFYKRADVKDSPINDKEKREKNINEGKGIILGNIGKGKGGGDFQFASANPMWRATLDILDFVPLSNADYGGGIISTDWYSENSDQNDSLKITIQFLTNEIRVDGIKVNIYQKKCEANNNCAVNKIDSDLNQELKMAILKRAAKLKDLDLRKKRSEKGKYKVTKTK